MLFNFLALGQASDLCEEPKKDPRSPCPMCQASCRFVALPGSAQIGEHEGQVSARTARCSGRLRQRLECDQKAKGMDIKKPPPLVMAETFSESGLQPNCNH